MGRGDRRSFNLGAARRDGLRILPHIGTKLGETRLSVRPIFARYPSETPPRQVPHKCPPSKFPPLGSPGGNAPPFHDQRRGANPRHHFRDICGW